MYNAIYVLFIVANVILKPGLIFLDLYALLLGLVIINKFSWESKSELLYYFVLLFSVMDFTFNLPLTSRYQIYYFHIALFILTVSMFVSFLKNRGTWQLRNLAANKYVLFLTIFIVYMILSLAWVSSRSAAIKYMVDYAIMICFLLAVYRFNKRPETLRQSLKLLFYATVLILVIGSFEMAAIRMPIRNIFSDNGWFVKGPFYLQTIPTVFFYNPNNYAVYLVLFVAFLVPAIVFIKSKPVKWLLTLIQLVTLMNIVFSTSRTSWITMYLVLAGFILFFAFHREKKRALSAFKIGLITFVVFYALSNVPALTVYYGKFNDTPILNMLSLHAKKTAPNVPLVDYGGDGSVNERYTIIRDVLQGVFVKGHWYGFGVDNTTRYLGRMGNTQGITNVHSLWFEILGDFGILMFLYLIYIYLSMLWDLLKVYLVAKRSAPDGLLAYLSVSLIAAMGGFIFLAFAPSSVINFSQMWLLYGLTVLVITKQKELLNEN